MTKDVDFDKYQYFYNGWVARKDKKTNKTEKFIKGKWTLFNFARDISITAHVGDEDIMELYEDSEQFLQEELERLKLKSELNKKKCF